MTIHLVSLYFETESQRILDIKFEIGMARMPLYILYNDDKNTAPIIRAENFFLECYDGIEEIRDLVLHNSDKKNQDIVLNATCTLNKCNQKINIYHVSPFGKDVVTAWYGKMAMSELPEVYLYADNHFFYWWRITPVNSAQIAFQKLLQRLDASPLLVLSDN